MSLRRRFRIPDVRSLLDTLGVTVIAYVYLGCRPALVPVRWRRRAG